jgi:transposase
MFFEGIRSERQLIETASMNLAHRWYLGYALDEPLPDHSSLTRIRQRLGVDVFQRFFEKVVDLCQAVGLVWGRELYVDATKVEANAGASRRLSPASTMMPRSTSPNSSRTILPQRTRTRHSATS